MTTHLTDLEVAAFVDRGIPENQRARIEQHLKQCGFCAGRVEETFAAVAVLDEPASLWEKIGEKIYRLSFSIPIWARPRQTRLDSSGFPAGLRFQVQSSGMLDSGSPGNEIITTYVEIPCQDNHFLFKLSMQPTRNTFTNVDLQVVDLVERPAGPHATVQLREHGSGRMLEWRRTDHNGQVIFKELETGDYMIQITYQGMTCDIPLSIKVEGEEVG